MKEKKKLLFYAMSLGGGGAQRQIANILDRLVDKEKYDIKVFVRHNDMRFASDHLLDEIEVRVNKSLPIKILRLDALFEFLQLFSYVRKRKIEIIYARGYPFYWKAALVKFLIPGIKLISVEVNYFSQNVGSRSSFSNFFLKRLCGFALINSDLVYCLTEASKDDLLSTLKVPDVKVKIFPVTFDIEEFQNIKLQENNFSVDEFNITCMGRFVRQKNHFFLINAFSRLQQDNYILHFFGEGPLRQDYEKRIKQLKLNQKVYINDFTLNPYSIIKQSDLVVFPSLYEGFGNILLESIFCGVPIISTNYFGIDRHIKDLLAQNGLLVELDDVDGLASRIQYVKNHYDDVKRSIDEIRTILAREYSLSKYLLLLEEQIDVL